MAFATFGNFTKEKLQPLTLLVAVDGLWQCSFHDIQYQALILALNFAILYFQNEL